MSKLICFGSLRINLCKFLAPVPTWLIRTYEFGLYLLFKSFKIVSWMVWKYKSNLYFYYSVSPLSTKQSYTIGPIESVCCLSYGLFVLLFGCPFVSQLILFLKASSEVYDGCKRSLLMHRYKFVRDSWCACLTRT